MEWMIWLGAGISICGLAGLIVSILKVQKARRAKLSDDELRAAVQKVMPLNMGALFLSVIGLMIVILGIFIG
ncbi:hypothetical protein SAMN04490248_10245 [Salinihabitans flavidus]|uniref:Uncharacterized protein n=1 Tax=Salinihabitans flavidus TaxID=569882 RepID=A0A1H8ME79_9RHOB|nr:hypothetical protein [Salinihabitans flavidus]SEO15639.1 hypothetical protein SAMN04490248_10245 [Salinihabitans flavidus]